MSVDCRKPYFIRRDTITLAAENIQKAFVQHHPDADPGSVRWQLSGLGSPQAKSSDEVAFRASSWGPGGKEYVQRGLVSASTGDVFVP